MTNENRSEDLIFQELTTQDQATISGGISISFDLASLLGSPTEDENTTFPVSDGKNQTVIKKHVVTETTYVNSSDPM